jgi:hypothetical protein
MRERVFSFARSKSPPFSIPPIIQSARKSSPNSSGSLGAIRKSTRRDYSHSNNHRAVRRAFER